MRRATLRWSQAELAERAGLPRTTLSAIESRRITPSVTTALALARALETTVESLFGGDIEAGWAWPPALEGSCRYWEARVDGRRYRYPVESRAFCPEPHDGVWPPASGAAQRSASPDTLVLASCDPAGGALAAAYAQETKGASRLLILERGGATALDLLRRGLVHVAGLHFSTREAPEKNATLASSAFNGEAGLLRVADWEEGLALPPGRRRPSPASMAARRQAPWALREEGAAARECLDQLLEGTPPSEGSRVVTGHAAVAEAVRAGWAGAGVCVRLSAAEAGLDFVPLRTESLDFCIPLARLTAPGIQALIRVIQSTTYRRQLNDLPGYDARHSGEWRLLSPSP